MCVDDYQFRHYSAIGPKQCRRFIFIDEDQIQKAFLVNISQFQQDGQIALSKIIQHLSIKGLPIIDRQFYWRTQNAIIKSQQDYKASFWMLSDKELIFDSQHIVKPQVSSISLQGFRHNSQIKEETNDNKQETEGGLSQSERCVQCSSQQIQIQQQCCQKQQINQIDVQNSSQDKEKQNIDKLNCSKRTKQSERSILQVIIALKKWRKLYESKKLNLTKAAKLIGISKKSLDDYFLVTRVGEILGFNYKQNLTNKMGDLRSYIRKFDHKVTGKLSKKVKFFNIVPDYQIDQILKQNEQNCLSSNGELDQNNK